MHIALDIRESCRANRTGKGQWAYGFTSELLERNHRFTLLTDENSPPEWRRTRSHVKVEPFAPGPLWHWNVTRWLRAQRDVDVYVSPTSFIVPFLLGTSVPHVPIVHDLIAFRGEPHDRKATIVEHVTLGRALRTARTVCTVSESTKKDVLGKYPVLGSKRVTPIFAGPLHAVAHANTATESTILCIGTLCPRKNQLRLIQAYALLPEKLRSASRLVLAGGRGWFDYDIIDLAQKTAGVEYKGYIDAAEYDRLLESCTVLALPSLYEGFGMQILDALQRGVPILTSERGSLPELVGDSALIVDPERAESIAKGLETILTDPELRSRLHRDGPARAALFNWKRTVDLFLDAIGG